MKRILLVAVLIILLSEGTGTWLLNRFRIRRKGLASPLGFAAILGVLQTLYYIPLMLHLSFAWIIGITSIVLLGAAVLTIRSYKDVLKAVFSLNALAVLVFALAFLFVFSKMYIDLDYSDSSTYLNYIAMNINAPQLNLYDLSNGLRGAEWNVYYLFQGYFHFGSYLCWLVNLPHYLLGSSSYVPNLVVSVWGLGLLYNVFSGSLIVTAVRGLHFRNKIAKAAVLLFALFYADFFYWDITFAFYGNTFRSLFIMLLIYIIYRWQKDDDDEVRYLLLFPLAAGFACSSSFLFMSFAVMFALAGYLFAARKPHALRYMIVLILPMVMYVCAYLARVMPVAGAAAAVLYGAVLLLLKSGKADRLSAYAEDLLYDHGKMLFFGIVPAVFALGSFAVHLLQTNDFTSYLYYFRDFRHSDMITDYLFLHSEWLDGLVNVLRWAGVILVIAERKPQSDQERWMRAFVIMMTVFFLNPLCTILLQKTITGMVFYRNFMVLFNPLTEAYFLWVIFRKLEEKKVFGYALSAALAAAVVIGNAGSFMLDEHTGLYWVYLKGGQNVDGVYKIHTDELQAITALKEGTDAIQDRQPVIVSQSGATLTYIPEAYSIFGPWNYYYAMDRVNEEFYQIARRHEDWIEEEHPDYTKSCGYLDEYNVDYVLLQYWQSPEFDEATDACTVTVYEGSRYKVKKREDR